MQGESGQSRHSRLSSAPARLSVRQIRRLGRVGRHGLLEVFSGAGRLTEEAQKHGVRAEGLDIKIGVDLFDRRIQARICALLRAGLVGFLWLAPECRTFSIASGRRAMRSREFPLGKPYLNEAQRRSVDYGNRILKITVRLARAAFEGGVGFAIENPQSSRVLDHS